MKRSIAFLAASLVAACSGSVDTTPGAGASTHGTGGAGAATTITTTGWGGAGNATTTGWGGAGNATTITTSTTWTTTSTTSGTGGAAVSCPGFGDPCSDCVSTACPAVFCACANDAQCLALSACFDNCNGDAPCQQACESKHPSGISELVLLGDCAGSFCVAECPGNKPISECTKCAVETCPDAFNACIGDPECVALYKCLSACGNVDLTCQQGCYAAHGTGTAKLEALLTCETSPCGPVCK